ncbi:MAG: nucleoside-diphosphate kinase [Candidatus Micrarchaeota archaeon]
MEKTCAILKPDCVEGRHCGEIVKIVLDNGFRVLALKTMKLDENILREHYSHHTDKPFFQNIVSFMGRTKVLVLLLEKENAIADFRRLCGPTDSEQARKESPGSIRAKFGKDNSENIIHASDGPETAKAEEERFFTTEERANISKEGLPLEHLKEIIEGLYR